MANAIPNVIRDLIQQGLTLLVLTGVAFYQNWKLATALLVVMPVSIYAIVKIGKRLRKVGCQGPGVDGRYGLVVERSLCRDSNRQSVRGGRR